MSDDKDNNFRENLLYWLGKRGISQRMLADETGISNRVISKYACGHCLPKADAIVRIADALHIATDQLLRKRAEPERRTGKWIKKMRVTETEKYTSYDPDWYCAYCGAKYDSHIAKIVNFCYVCGADMRGEQNENNRNDNNNHNGY